MTVEECMDLIELFSGRGGTVDDSLNRKLLLKLINVRLRSLYSRTLYDGPRHSGTTVEDVYEYDLPEGLIPAIVVLNGDKLDEIDFSKVVEERGE